ncbi:MAG: hypothetical protein AAFV53_10325 [Myxococcota bacterium]
MIWLFLSMSARADTFTLDNGATIEGVLAEYNMSGSCQISVDEGDLAGAILVIPCERISRFERTSASPGPAPALTSVAPAAPMIPTAPTVSPEPAPAPIAEPPVEEAVVDAPLALPPAAVPPAVAPFAAQPPDAPAASPALPEMSITPAAPEADVVAAPAATPEAPAAASPQEPLWADENGAPIEEGTVIPSPSVDRNTLPTLPNLRMLRRPDADPEVEVAPETDNQL